MPLQAILAEFARLGALVTVIGSLRRDRSNTAYHRLTSQFDNDVNAKCRSFGERFTFVNASKRFLLPVDFTDGVHLRVTGKATIINQMGLASAHNRCQALEAGMATLASTNDCPCESSKELGDTVRDLQARVVELEKSNAGKDVALTECRSLMESLLERVKGLEIRQNRDDEGVTAGVASSDATMRRQSDSPYFRPRKGRFERSKAKQSNASKK